MQFNESLLRQWVNPAITTEQLTDDLTAHGFEVDDVTVAAPAFQGVVVGHVLTREPHPTADRLSVCSVDVGDAKPLTIVCGAANVRAGLRVALIRVGGVLPNGTTIGRAKLRGVESEGMICSVSELGLAATSEGILELPDDAPIGQDFRSYWQLDDAIITLSVTPNRGDVLSIVGIAREVGAIQDMLVQEPTLPPVQTNGAVCVPRITVSTPEVAPCYRACVIKGVRSNEGTPFWLKEQLRRFGLKSIHPVVDVLNYIMLEQGTPLHAFDLGRLTGDVIVRFAQSQESLQTLEGSTVTLQTNDLVIADHKGPVAIAGVMGGLASGVHAETTDILIECAFFDPVTIGRTARRLGFHTDAAHRFQRGVDFLRLQQALSRAVYWITALVGGEVSEQVCYESTVHLPVRTPIILRAAAFERIMGVSLVDGDIEHILRRLQFLVQRRGKGEWVVTPPSWRFDITQEVDLIEEVARLYGYDRLPVQALHGALSLSAAPECHIAGEQVAVEMQALGYQEAVTYSFIARSVDECLNPAGKRIALKNPIAADLDVMRTTLWGGLLNALQYNLNRQATSVRLFEIGRTFEATDAKPCERLCVAGVMYGDLASLQWGVARRSVDFFDMKGDITALLSRLNVADAAIFEQETEHVALHPGRAASIRIGGRLAGHVGELHPVLVERWDFPAAPYVFALFLDEMGLQALPTAVNVPKYPSVRRDLAFLVNRDVTVVAIQSKIEKVAGLEPMTVTLFDAYQGKGLPEGCKSVAFRLVFHAMEATLQEATVNDAVSRVVEAVQTTFGATLRAS
ncbi:MAG: phenylalanine--tRNA ligase subunit beta [Gammaproteobacteria bacterium RIFCSPHIGHO2_12_FULL_45_9]|nr:MAG: phenylalanine--tRNA ligase subunit beta [Gammaproteobacteria bacterium RIFCSPHIGHO2_12_FULL_45_9]